MLRAVTSVVLISGFLIGSQVGAQELSEARVKELVAEALRENPELVLEALQALEQRQAEAEAKAALSALSAERSTLERDSNAPVLGNPDGDVTVVEFFDYNCPYCKQAAPEVDALLQADKNVRLVLREWPILSEGSAFAARAALASRAQGKYAEFHEALMTMRGKLEAETVLRIAGQSERQRFATRFARDSGFSLTALKEAESSALSHACCESKADGDSGKCCTKPEDGS